MRSSPPRAVLTAIGAVAVWIGPAHGASVRVSGPAEIVPDTAYTVYVEAENTGLNDTPTDLIEWEFDAPEYLSFDYVGKPLSGDFFSEDDGTPLAMIPPQLFGDPHTPGNYSARLVAEIAGGPVNRAWTSEFIRLGEYHFRLSLDAPAPLPGTGSFVLQEVYFYDPDVNPQPVTILTPLFEFDIKLSMADFDRDMKVNPADMAAFALCATGPNVPYDLDGLPSGCTCGTVDVGGQDYLKADFDHDGDVDQEDFAQVQLCYSGDTIADPNCGNDLVGSASVAVKTQSVQLSSPVPQPRRDSPLVRQALRRNSGQ